MTGRNSPRPVVAILLASLLGLLVIACGSDSDNSGKSEAKTEKQASSKQKQTGTQTGTEVAEVDQSAEADGPVTSTSDPLAGVRFFSNGSPWNTRATGMPVASDSDRMLELAMERRAVREVPGKQGIQTIVRRVNEGLFINTDAWAPLVVTANGPDAAPTTFVCRQSKCGSGPPDVPKELSIPANTNPDPRYDGWLSVIDRNAGIGYDFWRARRQTSGLISYQYAKAWTLDGPGFSKPVEDDPERAVGARGSGLPLFAGVIGPSALTGRGIDHALAIAVPGLARRNFVQPASVTDGVGSTDSLPAGARIRLRADVEADRRALGFVRGKRSTEAAEARRITVEAILQALREYGAIVVDRAAVPTLYAPKGTSATAIRGGELSWLSLSDFEVIQLPKIYKDPPLSKVSLEETGASQSGSGQTGTTAGGDGA